MTREDALAVVGVLSSAFPRAAGQQTIELYATQIVRYDLEAAMKAALSISRQDDRFPPLSVFLKAIQMAESLDAPTVEEPPLPERPPDWYDGVWKRARAVGDLRLVPEQIPGYVELGVKLPPLPWYFSDKETWVQAGEYGYEPSGYLWGFPAQGSEACCFHAQDAGLPTRIVMIVGPLDAMQFRMCLRCAATYEHRSAA